VPQYHHADGRAAVDLAAVVNAKDALIPDIPVSTEALDNIRPISTVSNQAAISP